MAKSHMPEFKNEEEFNKYFAKERAITDKHRDSNGVLSFNSWEEFTGMLDELFEGTGIEYEIR